MKRRALDLSVLFALSALAVQDAPAKVEFADAAVSRYGQAQLGYFSAFVMAKPANAEHPAKSLVGSALFSKSPSPKPLLDVAAIARNPELSAEAWLSYAESLYDGGQYDLADQALANIPDSRQRSLSQRFTSLQLKLALRGNGKLPAVQFSSETDPQLALNLVLAMFKPTEIATTQNRLRQVANSKTNPAAVRHRARIWMALLHLHEDEKRDAIRALSEIEGDSPLLTDTLLAYLRINDDVHPGALGAIAQRIDAAAPESSVAWETRERLVGALQKKGAVAQSGEVVLETLAELSGVLARIDQHIAAVETGADATPFLAVLPEENRRRCGALIHRKTSLLKALELLQAWRPHMDSYYSRLHGNAAQFADEIRDTFAVSNKSDAKNPTKLNELFGLALSNLVGNPPDENIAFRMFFGLAQWEFGFEYPEDWRPAQELGDEPRRRGRRAKDEMRRREAEDKQLLPEALEHANKLLGTINNKLGAMPGYIFHGEAERARSISARNATQAREIERMLPKLDDAIRSEVVQGLKERRRVAQQWLNRFAFHATSLYVISKTPGEQPYFELKKRLSIAKDDSVIERIEAIAGDAEKRTAGEIKVAAVWEALKPVAVGGATPQIRADALRLRAQLGVALYEAQAIPSAEPATKDYRELLRQYGDVVDRADVSYQLARAEDLAQHVDESLATLLEFVKTYPKDPRLNEARFRIGEIQFSLSEYGFAKAAYEAIIREGESRYQEQAQYKLGWTLFKLGDYREALPQFIAVVDRTLAGRKANDSHAQERVKDTFRAVTLIFSYLNGASDIELYFQTAGTRPYVVDIYYNLAKYYLEHGRINDASTTYGLLTRNFPNEPRAPSLLAELVAGARSERLAKIALELEERYAATYGVSGAYWKQASPEVRAQINTHMEPFLVELSQLYHADAQQQKNADSYAKAIAYYGQHIATFPLSQQTPHFHFLMAEARYETGDVPGAMLDYDKAAYDYGAHKDAAEAGYAALIANQKLAESESDAAQRKTRLRALVARSDRFASAFPRDVRVEAVLVKASEDILMLGEAAEAVKLGESLLARKPDETVRRRMSITLAHAYFESGAFAKAERAYQQALAQNGHTPATHKDLMGRLGLSVYRQAEAQRSAGDSRAAINTFLRVAEVAPGTEVVPSAEIDAAVLLLGDKQWRGAIEVLERFLKQFPKHDLAKGVPLKLAHAYENDGKLLAAAETFEGLSRSEPDDALARQLLLRSAELRQKDGRIDLAVATYERYLNLYPSPLDKATELRQTLADIAAKAKDLPMRDRWLNELISKAKAAGPEANLRVSFLAGQASLVFGDAKATEFEAVKLNLPLDKSLAAKRQAMALALQWYGEAGRYGIVEVTTIATYKTGEIYRRLAKDMLASERPAGLNELEKGQYNILLEEEASPFEDKATEFHELNYGRIKDGVYDDWVKRSLQSLRTLNASRYDRVEAAEAYFDYVPPKPKVEAAPTPGAPASAAAAPAVTTAPAAAIPAATVAPAAVPAPIEPVQGGGHAPFDQ
jgi:cellulose synthase operon protein C